jgi:hypothetical protein
MKLREDEVYDETDIYELQKENEALKKALEVYENKSYEIVQE